MRLVTLILCLALTITPVFACPALPTHAATLTRTTPRTYQFYGPWTLTFEGCAEAGLAAWGLPWTRVQDATQIPDVTLIRTALPWPRVGATGAGASVLLTTDPRRLDSCETMRRVVMHEVGHLLGLAHVQDTATSVMTPVLWRSAQQWAVADEPTACDWSAVERD